MKYLTISLLMAKHTFSSKGIVANFKLRYNNDELKTFLQGRVKFPTGGDREILSPRAVTTAGSGVIPEPTVQSGWEKDDDAPTA